MPYQQLSQLPPAVQKLPVAAQRVFRAAFNAAYDTNGEASAFRIAWSAVEKAGYAKDASGTWRKTRGMTGIRRESPVTSPPAPSRGAITTPGG